MSKEIKPKKRRDFLFTATYAIGAVGVSYGEYDDYGDNFGISYGFACGSYDCGFAYTDFSDKGYGADEDAFVFSVSASL